MGLISSSSISENTSNIIPHTWVVTIDIADMPGVPAAVLFWEPITGQQYLIQDSITPTSTSTTPRLINHHHYREIHAVFRHDRYYLNIQRSPILAKSNPPSIFTDNAAKATILAQKRTATNTISYSIKFIM